MLPLNAVNGASSTVDPELDETLQRSTLAFPVVGIGASAGGLEGLTRFFEHMPAETGMAFVVILHLSPNHESHAGEILQRATSMPVVQLTTTQPIQADHVYVIAPTQQLSMSDGQLIPSEAHPVHGRHVSIDTFFRTLAQVHREHAISIVLSGTGTDGAVGLTRIKEHGGLALAQLPADAAHDGMPRAAIATGVVDFVLPVAAMPQKLVELWSNVRQIRLPRDIAGNLRATAESIDEERASEKALREIMTTLRARTHHDFRHYKRATVLRRIERRMQVNGVSRLPAYRDFLGANIDETPALLQDMLISVTNFFRDRDAFEALERDALPMLMADHSPGRPIRAWVAGCATGEEAYSLAMLLQDVGNALADPPAFQIFGSDIDERAIGVARTGLYPSSIVTDVSATRLRQYFQKEQDHFRVTKAIRERVLFANHNVLRDPPFSRLNLISCRNLLIYLDRQAQAAVLEMFRFALRPGGVLFLGSSESADVAADFFTLIDKKHRLYRVNQNSRPLRLLPLSVEARGDCAPGTVPTVAEKRKPPYAEMHQRALEASLPPSVLVDAEHRILHLSEGAGRYLTVPGGLPSHDLLENVQPSLRLELRAALFRARQSGASVEARGVRMRRETGDVLVNLTVRSFRDAQDSLDLQLVLFDEVSDSVLRPPEDEDGAQGNALIVSQLEAEINRLKRHLQDTVEHSETSAEEMKSSNEELQAINEELRSASEELETSKEELQSTNEELITVNYELAMKVEETSRVNDDLKNLTYSTDIATVFIDGGMRIKRYTPRAVDLFNLIASDIGRSLLHITHRLDYDSMLDDATSAFETLRVIEREVASNDGRRFIARVLPYRTADDKIEGAILTFVDVTSLRESERRVRAGEERLRLAAESTRDFAIITLDDAGLITGWNLGASRIFGYGEAESVDQPLAMLFTEEDRAKGAPEHEMRTAREFGRAEDERWLRRKDGSVFFASGVMTPLDGVGARGFSKIARDLTGSKQAQTANEALLAKEQSVRRQAEAAMVSKEEFLAIMSHELKHPLNLIHINAELLMRLPEIRLVASAVRAAGIIQRTVIGQAKIIDDLLDLSRARTGKLSLHPMPVDWIVVVNDIVEAMRPDAEAKDVRLTFERDDTKAMTSLFDPVRAEQIVWNLLANALKFTPEGGAIEVRLSVEGSSVRLDVSDTGKGIAAEFIDHVFDMFSQEPGANRRQEGGLGIGLALVRELSVAHGGRVAVRSAGVGLGASFSVWVPLQSKAVLNAVGTEPGASLKGLKLLLVDDSIDSLDSFSALLELVGAEVATADSGAKALALMSQTSFDVLISDVGMPGMSGYELIAEVRRRGGTARLPAVACSGYARVQDSQRAIMAGFDALVPKPVSLEEMEHVIGQLLAGRRGLSPV